MAQFLMPRITTKPLENYPFSLLVKANGFAFLAGQGPVDHETGKVVEGDIKVQTEKTIENIRKVLEAEGLSLNHIVRATIYLTDIDDFDAMSGEYEKHFSELPARTTVGVASLWGGIKVEIEVTAVIDLEA